MKVIRSVMATAAVFAFLLAFVPMASAQHSDADTVNTCSWWVQKNSGGNSSW